VIGNDDYMDFARRVIGAAGRRVAQLDVEALSELVDLREAVRDAIDCAIAGLLVGGYTYAEVGRVLGVTRQAIFQQYGHLVTRTNGKVVVS
jgi:hypothetical protein